MNGQIIKTEKNDPLDLALREIESEKKDDNTEGFAAQPKPVESDLSDIGFGVDTLAMRRKRSREESRSVIAEDETEKEKHNRFMIWLRNNEHRLKRPDHKQAESSEVSSEVPAEVAPSESAVTDTESEVSVKEPEATIVSEQVQADRSSTVAEDFEPAESSQGDNIVDISDKVKREEPAPDGASLSAEFGLDQKRESVSIEPKARVQEMASGTEPAVLQNNETPQSSVTSNTISADFIAPSQEKRSLRSLFNALIPKGNADSKSFSALDLTAKDRSKETQKNKVEQLDSAA